MISRLRNWLNPRVDYENIIPVGTERWFGDYRVRAVVEHIDDIEPDEDESPPYVTVAECGHCFEDVGKPR